MSPPVPETGPRPTPAPGASTRRLADHLPELAPSRHESTGNIDGIPLDPLLFVELADLVALRLACLDADRDVLVRAFAAVEELVSSCAHDEQSAAVAMVADAFFDSFSPESTHRLEPWLGPSSRALLEALDASPAPDGRQPGRRIPPADSTVSSAATNRWPGRPEVAR